MKLICSQSELSQSSWDELSAVLKTHGLDDVVTTSGLKSIGLTSKEAVVAASEETLRQVPLDFLFSFSYLYHYFCLLCIA